MVEETQSESVVGGCCKGQAGDGQEGEHEAVMSVRTIMRPIMNVRIIMRYIRRYTMNIRTVMNFHEP